MANITLPDIKKSLDFNDGSLQWVLTAYSIMVSNSRSRKARELLDTMDPTGLCIQSIDLKLISLYSTVGSLWLEAAFVTCLSRK